MKIKDALKRIEELERKILELEARPQIVYHNHYHTYPNPALYPFIPQLTTYPNMFPTTYCNSLQGGYAAS